MIIDIYHHQVGDWMIVPRRVLGAGRTSGLGSSRQAGIDGDQLVIRPDRRITMASKMVVLPLASLGITKSFLLALPERCPYLESRFQELKDWLGFLNRSGSIEVRA